MCIYVCMCMDHIVSGSVHFGSSEARFVFLLFNQRWTGDILRLAGFHFQVRQVYFSCHDIERPFKGCDSSSLHSVESASERITCVELQNAGKAIPMHGSWWHKRLVTAQSMGSMEKTCYSDTILKHA